MVILKIDNYMKKLIGRIPGFFEAQTTRGLKIDDDYCFIINKNVIDFVPEPGMFIELKGRRDSWGVICIKSVLCHGDEYHIFFMNNRYDHCEFIIGYYSPYVDCF